MAHLDYFPIPFSSKEQVFLLDDHQIAMLFKSLFAYASNYSLGVTSTTDISDKTVKIVFVGIASVIRDRIDEYRRKCEINSDNARGHGAPKGNQNARKYTEEEINQARKDLANGDFTAAKTIVNAITQRNMSTFSDDG